MNLGRNIRRTAPRAMSDPTLGGLGSVPKLSSKVLAALTTMIE